MRRFWTSSMPESRSVSAMGGNEGKSEGKIGRRARRSRENERGEAVFYEW